MARLPIEQSRQYYGGVVASTVKYRIRKGQLEGGPDDKGRWFVEVPDDLIAEHKQQSQAPPAGEAPLREQIASLRGEVEYLRSMLRDKEASQHELMVITAQAQRIVLAGREKKSLISRLKGLTGRQEGDMIPDG